MKEFLNFVPMLSFFIFYKIYDIFIASEVLIFTSAMTLIINYIVYRECSILNLISFILICIFGTSTVLFHNTLFIKLKITILYCTLSLILLLSQFCAHTPLIKYLFQKHINLPIHLWYQLNLIWSVFFMMCGLINFYIAYYLSENTWIFFKVFVLTIITVIFSLGNFLYIIYMLK
ncbi:inner membrane-spanning protein YciB [Buchnera aphidicola]|uniref:inner membrane-spanning protein YciB n=1 Tax=Buchnera aphidicola TaxID=9 RepID=UPI00130DC591|nr:inner membrane-spanning protein YciB [Buchnera aphidicola]